MAQITLKNICKEYGDGFKAVNDISLDIADGEFMILVGPSGCGKSTTLRMVVGLEDITSGDLEIDGRRVNDLAPKDRNLAMVFQNYALYPHLSVRDNIAFPLRLGHNRIPEEEVDRRVREAAEMLELTEHLDRRPANLSGGQRQRVAIARALANDPSVLLCDEATSALDPKTTGGILDLLGRLNAQTGLTVVLITHEMGVVKQICSHVAVMEEGRIIERGSTVDVFTDPPITP